MSNPLVVIMVIIMLILLLVIALLAHLLMGTAGFYAEKVKKEEAEEKKKPVLQAIPMIVALLLSTLTGMAQDAKAPAPSATIGGLPASTFYLMSGVIFFEIVVILALLINVRILVAREKTKKAISRPVAKPAVNWWNRLNGIREVDNRLPRWWLYGFFVAILFAGIYLWRNHVSAPSSEEELQTAMVKAEEQKQASLKKSAANVDETTVKLSTNPADLNAGKNTFQSSCAPCHGKSAEGIVGPNLTDDYWLHGGSVKDIFKIIKYGVPEKGMKSWKDDFSPTQIAQLSSYIKSLNGTNPPNGKEKQGELYVEKENQDSTADKVVVLSK